MNVSSRGYVMRDRVLFVLVLAWLLPANAHAYLDPGTGSLIYQTVLALALGVGFVFRRFWARIARAAVGVLKRRSRPASGDGPSPK